MICYTSFYRVRDVIDRFYIVLSFRLDIIQFFVSFSQRLVSYFSRMTAATLVLGIWNSG